MIDLSSDAWAAVGIAIATTGSTVAAITIAHLKTSRQARGIDAHVEEVRTLAEPTGNGFAGKVLEGLDQVVKRLDAMEQRQVNTNKAIVNHLGDHARAEINRED